MKSYLITKTIYVVLHLLLNQTRVWYCRINLSVPILDRFFNHVDRRLDFRLSRESMAVLLNLMNPDRQHGWGATIETLVFLFWLARGASYRWSQECLGCLILLSTTLFIDSQRGWWPLATRSCCSQRPSRTWRYCPVGLQGWHAIEPF